MLGFENMSISAIDLFCGVGGLTRGLLNVGMPVKAGFDSDNSCRYAYEHNNNAVFENVDICTVQKQDVLKYFDKNTIKVVVGCAPCQPFSSYTPKSHSGSKNSKWGLLYQYIRIVKCVSPDIISMENVPMLQYSKPFDDFLKSLSENGYHYSYSIVKCEEYGIPQTRRRLVLFASKYGPIKIQPPNNKCVYTTLRDAIGNLPPIADGETCPNDPLHRCQHLSKLNKERIQCSKPGGTWKDWPSHLKLQCHSKPGGSTYNSVYGRMSWDKPAPTVTTEFFNYGSGRFGHPEQNRALSLREGALIQTFPPEYEFVPGNKIKSVSNTATHIGNAVPVKLGEVIGTTIMSHLKQYGVSNE